jgi:hypothetical protein
MRTEIESSLTVKTAGPPKSLLLLNINIILILLFIFLIIYSTYRLHQVDHNYY